jgi:hypothetical protein
VKSADIGQIIVVSPPGGALPSEDVSVNGVTVALRYVPEAFTFTAPLKRKLLSRSRSVPPQGRAAHAVPSPTRL